MCVRARARARSCFLFLGFGIGLALFVCLFVAGLRCLRNRKSGSYRTKFLVQLFEELDKALDLK